MFQALNSFKPHNNAMGEAGLLCVKDERTKAWRGDIMCLRPWLVVVEPRPRV